MPVEDKGSIDFLIFGGTDSRSSALNMPSDRSLWCINWVPNQGGWLELRRGYTQVATGGALTGAIHSIVPYTMYDGTRYLLIGQDVNVYSFSLATGEMDLVGQVGSTNNWDAFAANGQIHIGEGTGVWFFDGKVVRPSGIRSLTAAEAANFSVATYLSGVANPGSVTLTLAGGGTWPADSQGRVVMAANYNLDDQQYGPITTIGPNNGQIKLSANQQIQIGGLPVSSNSRVVKLPLVSEDMGNVGRFQYDYNVNVASAVILNQNPSISTSSGTTSSSFTGTSFTAATSGNLSPGPETITISGAERSKTTNLGQLANVVISGTERSVGNVRFDRFGNEIDTTFYDSGVISVNVNAGAAFNFTISTRYGQGSTPTSLAIALSNQINASYSNFCTSIYATGVFSVKPVSTTVEVFVTVSSYTSSVGKFPSGSTSFPVSTQGSPCGQGNVYDTGNVTVTLGGIPVNYAYGQGSTPSTIAAGLSSLLNGLPASGISTLVTDNVITVQQASTGVYVKITIGTHPITVDQIVGFVYVGDPAWDNSIFTVKAIDATSITVLNKNAKIPPPITVMARVVFVPAAGTSINLVNPQPFTPFIGTPGTGIPPTAVGGAQPGYQLYACIWNPVTGHVGNRSAIGYRIQPSVYTSLKIGGLPNLVNESAEWQILFGYTNDGGQVPYAAIDTGGNRISAPSGATQAFLNSCTLDYTSELPYRNGVPNAMNKFCVIGDQAIGLTGTDAFVYISGSDQSPLNPETVGRPEQSWYPSDVVTFPTREVPTCIAEYNGNALVFSQNYGAPLSNSQGIWDWGQGYPVGCAGQRAFCKTIHGPYWVSGQKQLCTSTAAWGEGYAILSGPAPISGEYEMSLLSKIGDQYLSTVELVPVVDVATGKDHILIKCQDATGAPFIIVHDFKLKDQRSPYGQAYLYQYQGALSSPFTAARGMDLNGLARPYAGGSDGNLYLLESGYNDNTSEFSADIAALVPLGDPSADITEIVLWGDSAILNQEPLTVTRSLDGTSDWVNVPPVQDAGDGDNDFKFHCRFGEGALRDTDFIYIRLQFTSHSADAPATILSPQLHRPLEQYGKIFAARAFFGTSSIT